MKTRALAWFAAMLVAAGLSGCAMFNRGMMNYTRTTTIGKELIDLKDAKDKGALSDEEYAQTKKAILEGGPVQVSPACKK
jgi:hypothetical protein